MFRLLYANEIDVRVATINEKGCTLLLYKDARCDMNILDETVGQYNWKRQHTRDNANCVVSLWDENKKEWISKEDTGTESFTEKEKGLASDSFKRACFNWGIGRELYTAPFIYVSAKKIGLTQKNGKYSTYDKFYVDSIEYDTKRQIVALVIKNQKGEEVFSTKNKPIKVEEEKYTCSECGSEIKGAKKDGKIISAKEVHSACNGLCLKCWKEKQKQEE